MSAYLCPRCKALSDLVEKYWSKENELVTKSGLGQWQMASVDAGPFSDHCYLCTQFQNYLDGERLELRYHEIGDDEWTSSYFSIFQTISRRESCLVPTEAFFRHRYNNNKRKTLVHSVLTEKPDFGLVAGWLTHCRVQHEQSCRTISFRGTVPKRLIDCQHKQLCINSGKPYPYVCLSYIWGKLSPNQIDSDMDLPQDMPQLILDAMFVTVQLGLRYLWIDRYCIDQQNAEEKHDAIQNMGDIYNAAELTIIAAAGSDPDYGLSGVSRHREARKTITLHGQVFNIIENPRQEISASKWNTRGWTYQEMYMSRRRLVFTGVFHSFAKLMEHCATNVTHFYGIPIHFDGKPSSLPTRSFALGLTWQVVKKDKYTEHCVYDGCYPAYERNILFPSWSWASFMAQRSSGCSGQLVFHRRPPVVYETFKSLPFHHEFQIGVTHISGREMSLEEFTGHPDDYTRFNPWIDITSMTTACWLSTHGNTVRFAQKPQRLVPAHLHRDPRCLSSSTLTAVLNAILPQSESDQLQAVFLLVEKVTYLNEYRLVGVCCDRERPPDGTSGWDQSIREGCWKSGLWFVGGRPRLWGARDEEKFSLCWKWQTLRII